MTRRPDFLLIGAAKSGTSALYNQLASHPEIYMAPIKEPNYFALEGRPASFRAPGDDDTINRRSVADRDAYLALFNGAGDAAAAGEASTSYLYTKVAPASIHRFDPEMKLVAMLRDPVDRALSSYRHLVRDGWETESFEGGLVREEERIADGWSHIWHYASAGHYAKQLKRYTALFPASRLRVFVYERFLREPEVVLREIFQFLGVDPHHRPNTSRRYNVSGEPRSRLFHRLVIGDNLLKRTFRPLVPRWLRSRVVTAVQSWNVAPGEVHMEEATRELLADRFAGDMEALERCHCLDLSDWTRPRGEGRKAGA